MIINKFKTIFKGRRKYFLLPFLCIIVWFWFSLPSHLFKDPTSTILEDNQGNLLAAKIAKDGQWRFPESDSIPEKYALAVKYFEDEYYDYHLGVNPVSLFRAFKQNFSSDKIISGGSTITMQLIRLSRKGQKRSYFEKFIEVILATRLELSYSKQEILNLYASHAPFGGNVVGLEAASWRYYGRQPHLLSWGEIATLAVLPNAPSLIYPGKNQERLLTKRNKLLDKLALKGVLTQEEAMLAKSEPLPGKPFLLPQITPHLLDRIALENHEGEKVETTINLPLQEQLNKLIDRYHKSLAQNEVHNAAILVLDVTNGEVLAYVGNTDCPEEESGSKVDIITSKRSTGSTLKPFLFASMLEDGLMLPHALVEDVPTRISGYAPQNFDKSYDGAVPASNALTRSLNIPAVKMLQTYGIEPFYQKMQQLGLKSINKGSSHYGLSLILGGAESSLWELCSAYYSWARKLNGQKIETPNYIKRAEPIVKEIPDFSRGAIYQTLEVLTGLNRPSEEGAWKIFESSRKIAWKTGTSFGQRDAWAIGVTPEYVVGVWVGNADGEGRPGLTGIQVAAPILFNAFDYLPETVWFDEPMDELVAVNTCAKSGFKASNVCPKTTIIKTSPMGVNTSVCSFHRKIHLDQTEQYRVNSNCYEVANMVEKSWFVLPPVQEWYYKTKNPDYKTLPPIYPACVGTQEKMMALIYPKEGLKIFVPKNLDGTLSRTIFEAAHRRTEAEIHWYLDEDYLGATKRSHQKEILTTEGKHQLTLVDNDGNTIEKTIEFVAK
ncbi:MAG: penicillin-binding protein 1C [Flavobacteriales bacterium]|nr:penicillin-binding protein 1C [Flavobacteriales bacterium]